jgi:hypothetical protein
MLTPAGYESAGVPITDRRSAIDPDLRESSVKRAVPREVLAQPLRIDLPAPARVVRSMKRLAGAAVHILVVEKDDNAIRHQAAKE